MECNQWKQLENMTIVEKFLTSLCWRQREVQVSPWPRALYQTVGGWRSSWPLGPSMETQKGHFSVLPYLSPIFTDPSMAWRFWSCVILHLLFLRVSLFGSMLALLALNYDCKILFEAENLLLRTKKPKQSYQKSFNSVGTRNSNPKGNTAYILHNFPRFWTLCYLCHCFVSLHPRCYSNDRSSQVAYTSHSAPLMHIRMEQADNSSHSSP